MTRTTMTLAVALLPALLCANAPAQTIDIGSRRELFVDRHLIGKLTGARLVMHSPQPAPPSARPLENVAPHGGYAYATVFRDGDVYRLYGRRERGKSLPDSAPRDTRWFNQVTCYAESPDGINWTEPNLGIYRNVPEIKAGNVTLAWEFGATHNFTPFLDTNPAAPASQRYKAVAGAKTVKDAELLAKYGVGGLRAYVSADGLRWKRLRDEPIIPSDWGFFDSQNLAFWSVSEQCYVCYFRVFDNKHSPGVRAVRRSTSKDFLHWTGPVDVRMNRPRPGGANRYSHRMEQLYVNNIKPYFRAPHIYIGLPTRVNFDRNAPSETLLMTSRDGVNFDRTFTGVFCRPGAAGSYGNRGHYCSNHLIQTGPAELSIYNYNGGRWTLRLDGLASLNAPFSGGQMVTRPLTFKGERLRINARTAGIGSVRVEIQDARGKPVAGYALEDCTPMTGDDVSHEVSWTAGPDVSKLSGKPIRLRFVMTDADVYSLRFAPASKGRS
jgi:hypothetical protein